MIQTLTGHSVSNPSAASNVPSLVKPVTLNIVFFKEDQRLNAKVFMNH